MGAEKFIKVSFFLVDGEMVTMDVPWHLHKTVRYTAENSRIPWNDIYSGAVGKYGLSIESVGIYLLEEANADI